MLTKAPRGTYDLFGERMDLYNKIISIIGDITKLYNVKQIKTPIFEHTELFLRGVGETTDIVSKEMYTFNDKGNRSITLRPEGTAGVARAFIENKMYANPQPTKLYYINENFRYEKPQAGRFREFRQFGVEYFGTDSFLSDVEVISLAKDLLESMGIANITLKINSLGDKQCRENYNNKMAEFINNNLNDFCPTCQERAQKNPLRVLDCKNEDCNNVLNNAPSILEILGDECKEHFSNVLKGLDALDINYVIDNKLVRGLDYYTKSVFEFISDSIGAQGTICGGGRYNYLIEECDGPATPAVGFGLGLERLMLAIDNLDDKIVIDNGPTLFLGATDDIARIKAIETGKDLRKNNISVVTDITNKSVKAQMKYANKIGAKYSAIIGDSEMETLSITVKNMDDGAKDDISFDSLVDFFDNKIN